MNKQDLKVAIVFDPLYKYGGAEKHLKETLKIFPNSTVYTAFYDKDFVNKEFPGVKIKCSFMQYLPFKFKLRELFFLFQPLAYRAFRFKDVDAVLSISIGFAKFVRAKVPHINICLSPTKFFWMKDARSLKSVDQFKGLNKSLYKFYAFFMDTFLEDIWKKWDKGAAQRVDHMIAISKVVQKRIKKFYDRDSHVIYPPVEVRDIISKTKVNHRENWFLYLGRIETYKGVKLAIKAAYDAKVPLKVAGTGNDLDAMKELVKDLNARGYVKFLGFISDDEKLRLLSRAKAVVFPVREEDFGIVPVEANAAGAPVIAYREGGVVETVSERNPKSGVFFNKYNYKSLSKVLKNFDGREYKAENCRKQSQSFAVEIYQYKLRTYIEDVIQSK